MVCYAANIDAKLRYCLRQPTLILHNVPFSPGSFTISVRARCNQIGVHSSAIFAICNKTIETYSDNVTQDITDSSMDSERSPPTTDS